MSRLITMVGLARQLSNPTPTLTRLLKLKAWFTSKNDEAGTSRGQGSNGQISSPDEPIPLKQLKRLKPLEKTQIIAGFKTGQSSAELATQFGVGRRTINIVLKQDRNSASDRSPDHPAPAEEILGTRLIAPPGKRS